VEDDWRTFRKLAEAVETRKRRGKKIEKPPGRLVDIPLGNGSKIKNQEE